MQVRAPLRVSPGLHCCAAVGRSPARTESARRRDLARHCAEAFRARPPGRAACAGAVCPLCRHSEAWGELSAWEARAVPGAWAVSPALLPRVAVSASAPGAARVHLALLLAGRALLNVCQLAPLTPPLCCGYVLVNLPRHKKESRRPTPHLPLLLPAITPTAMSGSPHHEVAHQMASPGHGDGSGAFCPWISPWRR